MRQRLERRPASKPVNANSHLNETLVSASPAFLVLPARLLRVTRRINAKIQNRAVRIVVGGSPGGQFHRFLLAAGCAERRCNHQGHQGPDVSDPLVKNASADVTAHGHVVTLNGQTLTGQAPDDSAHWRRTSPPPARKGVSKVNDQINVPTAPAEPSFDASSTTPAAAAPTSLLLPPEPRRPPLLRNRSRSSSRLRSLIFRAGARNSV